MRKKYISIHHMLHSSFGDFARSKGAPPTCRAVFGRSLDLARILRIGAIAMLFAIAPAAAQNSLSANWSFSSATCAANPPVGGKSGFKSCTTAVQELTRTYSSDCNPTAIASAANCTASALSASVDITATPSSEPSLWQISGCPSPDRDCNLFNSPEAACLANAASFSAGRPFFDTSVPFTTNALWCRWVVAPGPTFPGGLQVSGATFTVCPGTGGSPSPYPHETCRYGTVTSLTSTTVQASCSDPGQTPTYDATNGIRCVQPAYAVSTNLGNSCEIKGNTAVANPCNPAIGNKFQSETDYVGNGPHPLKFVRYYNSLNQGDVTAGLGPNWTHTYSRKLQFDSSTSLNTISAVRDDGRAIAFNKIGAVYKSDATFNMTLELLSGDLWRLTTTPEDEVELYDDKGKLLFIQNRNSLRQTLAYQSGQVSSVTDAFGRTLTFTRDTQKRIQSVSAPGSVTISYTYSADEKRNLVEVTYADMKKRSYHYGNSSFPNHLTGITDENLPQFATYEYDINGRVSLSQHANGAGKVTLTNDAGSGTRNVTVRHFVDALQSEDRTYVYESTLGLAVNTGVQGAACPTCGPAARTYDANGNVASRTDWNGNRTNYTYDLTRNLETSRTEGLTSGGGTTPQTRTITTQWHAVYRLPTAIAEPFRITTLVYGASNDANPGNRGSVLSRTIQATTDANGSAGFGATLTGTPRAWAYTYNANGSVLSMNGPRTDVSDITNYAYYTNSATCPGVSTTGCRGQIETITNAVGHITQITEYNAHGQPLTIVDPNGLTTTFAYDPRQRLTSRNVGGETTTYTYDNAGQLARVTLPDTSYLEYTYDNAYRLTQIADNLGNRITYTLDLAGNRTLEEVRDPSNQLAQTRSRIYNSLNRLNQEIGAASQTTAYGYDNQGNLTSIDGPLTGTGDTATNTYDALNRLATSLSPTGGGTTTYGYNGLDQLTSVSDPRSLVTSYAYDGLNNLNQQVSPDTGTTFNTYDTAGNLLTQTDAKGQVTNYAATPYDALNRVTGITYQGGITHTYTYDQGTNGKGRLTQIIEPNSTTNYVYDQKGRLTSETRVINAVSYVTTYSYDATGRMTGITYPSGRQVTYTLDFLGRIQSIATTKDSATQTVVSSVAYRPFGPTQGFTFGNGQTYSRGFDTDGRIASYTLATQSIAVGYDLASRIGFLSDTAVPANTNNYGYDNLDRLTSFTGPSTNQAFTYDGVGNRLTKTVGANTDTYIPSATSNRLATITGTNNRTYTYDNNGSTTGDSINTYAYDTRGRMVQAVSTVGTTDYKINSLGQRIRKINPQGDTIYHYDAQGRLIAESSASGEAQKEYIYLGDTPVAVIQQ